MKVLPLSKQMPSESVLREIVLLSSDAFGAIMLIVAFLQHTIIRPT